MVLLKAVILALFLAPACHANTIEGFTPSGKFKTVGVSEAGRFFVDTATGIAQHVIVDTGTVTATQAAGQVYNVATSVGVAVTVVPSTSTVVVSAAGVATAVPSIVYPADANRTQGVLCNTDPSGNILVGNGVSQSQVLFPGSCLSPDVPSAFTGSITGVSTSASVTWSYIYFK